MANPKDWFGLVVRVFGLFGLYYGMYALVSVIYYVVYHKASTAFPFWYLCSGVAYMLAGFYLVRGAPQLMRLAYPDAPAAPVAAAATATGNTEPRNPWDARA